MRVLVLYESMFGNTHLVADAIAEGIRGARFDATVTIAVEASVVETCRRHLPHQPFGPPAVGQGHVGRFRKRHTADARPCPQELVIGDFREIVDEIWLFWAKDQRLIETICMRESSVSELDENDQ